MSMIDFFLAAWGVLLALAPWLFLGAGIAGLLHVVLPAEFLARHLSGKFGVVRAVGWGVPLPLCSCSVIPVGISLKSAGASPGAVNGFLISTPQTGVDSVLVSASLLGWPFALFKLVSAAVMGLLGGWLTDALVEPKHQLPIYTPQQESQTVEKSKVVQVLEFGLEVIHSIWRWLLLGILISALIETVLPADTIGDLAITNGLWAMLVTLVIAVPLYICATASVPIAAALVAAGMPTGTALVFLIAGPATNTATLGAVFRTLGGKSLATYLATVITGSLLCGWAFDAVLETGSTRSLHAHGSSNWWSIASAIILLAMFVRFAYQELQKVFGKN